MKLSRSGLSTTSSGQILLAAAGLLLSACSANHADGQILPVMQEWTVSPDTYLLLADDRLPANLERRVTEAGGTLEFAIPDAGIAFARSDDRLFRDRAGSIAGIKRVAPDIGLHRSGVAQGDVTQDSRAIGLESQYSLQWAHDAMDVPEAWALGARGAGVRVAVIDTGALATHPDLAGRFNTELSRSVADGLAWDVPFGVHGTSVAGIIGASDDGVGLTGVAPEAELVMIQGGDGRHRDDIFVSWTLGALAYAIAIDADVVNLSFGELVPRSGGCINDEWCVTGLELAAHLEAFNRLSTLAWQNDTLMLIAAGNSRRSRDAEPDLVHLPGDAEFVFAVSATGPRGWGRNQNVSVDSLADYTVTGPHIMFAAPGGNIDPTGSTEPCTVGPVTDPCNAFDGVRLAGYGVPKERRDPTAVPGDDAGRQPSYGWGSGTSYAAPHAAGVAALVFSVLTGTERSASHVLDLMRDGADDLGPPGRDSGYGFGRLNAANSVRLALER